jgi:glycosyltransferase involved in cell wall biosynthesis
VPSERPDTMKILILTRTLKYGGAQRQAVVLTNELARRGHDVWIAPFYGGGELEQGLDVLRVHLVALNKRSRWDLLPVFWKLLRTASGERFNLIFALGLGPNLMATLLHGFLPKTILFWSIRKSYTEVLDEERPSEFGWLARTMARFADRVVFNSQSGLGHAIYRGYPPDKLICIPNGINTREFYPDAESGARVRTEWGFGRSQKLVGLVGRLDPAKNHADFLRAAARVAQKRSDVHFVCLGEGPAEFKSRLQALSRELEIEDKVRWIAPRRDMRGVYNALDLCCLSSITEGFPNVIGEAMACARPCVATDVGDCRLIVGETGRVVSLGDANALAQGMLDQLSSADTWNERGRERIVENFSTVRLGSRIEEVLSREMAQPTTISEAAH